MTSPVDLRYTDPLTGSGALDGSPVGVTDVDWSDVVGVGARGGSAATFSGAASGTAFAVGDFGMADADIRVATFAGLGGGDALYFRVSDANNWWRLRQRHQRTTSTAYGPYTYGSWVLVRDREQPEYSPPGTYYEDYVGGEATRRVIITRVGPNRVHVKEWTRSASRSTYQVTNDYRYLVVDKCVAGSVATVTSWSVNSFGILRVDLMGARVQWYDPDGVSVRGFTTDGFNQAATAHGFGLGGTDSTAYGSLLHDFRVQLPGSLVPPSIEVPTDGADVDISVPVMVRIGSNYGEDNPLTNVDIRWRRQSDQAWTEELGARSSPGEWLFSTAGMLAPLHIEMQARGTDSFANQSGWSPSISFWLRQLPTPPSVLSPGPGDTVVASRIATIDFGVDATDRQARRVGDDPNHPGVTDEGVVYQEVLTLAPTGVPGVFEASGDGAIHPSGPEHIQARRRTTDGGSAWSPWTDLLVMMSLAHPYAPTAEWVVLPDDAAIAFTVAPTPGDQTHPDGVELTVFRDGVPVYRTEVDGSVVDWTDRRAGAAHDYEFRMTSSNGGAVVVK